VCSVLRDAYKVYCNHCFTNDNDDQGDEDDDDKSDNGAYLLYCTCFNNLIQRDRTICCTIYKFSISQKIISWNHIPAWVVITTTITISIQHPVAIVTYDAHQNKNAHRYNIFSQKNDKNKLRDDDVYAQATQVSKTTKFVISWSLERSQPCRISSKLVKGIRLPEGSKFAIFLRLEPWPLNNRLGLPTNLWLKQMHTEHCVFSVANDELSNLISFPQRLRHRYWSSRHACVRRLYSQVILYTYLKQTFNSPDPDDNRTSSMSVVEKVECYVVLSAAAVIDSFVMMSHRRRW